MQIKILHLSDLHFKNQDISQDIVISSLKKKIGEISRTNENPNTLMLTGDIAFSGKAEEYIKAKEFLKGITTCCKIDSQSVFIIPGNHDVDRDQIQEEHITWWYNFTDEKSLITNLTSDISFPHIFRKSKAFYEFANNYMDGNQTMAKYGQFVFELPLESKSSNIKLKIVGLNSSLFCGYEGDDKEKLALGLEQINYCETMLNEKEDIVITCIHHPFKCFHSCEKTTLKVLQRFSDIILSGHVHEPSNSAHKDGNMGDTIFITSGASYENRNEQNGFNIIHIDTDTMKGFIKFYKYLPDEHTWIPNKDINYETDGIFNFEISKESRSKISNQLGKESEEINANKTERYMLVLDTEFDSLNRCKVDAIINHLKTLTKDVNTTITKIEHGSVKIYFETSKDVSWLNREMLKKIDGLEIIEIRKMEDNIYLKTNVIDKSVYHWKTTLKPEFSEDMESPGATFTHSRADILKLDDLYVHPNLNAIKPEENRKEKFPKVSSSKDVLEKKNGMPLKIIIYGSDSCGKSTLTRWWYDHYYEDGFIPILINGNEIKDIRIEKINNLVHQKFNEQYQGILDGNIEDFEVDRIIVIIDDFHRIRFKDNKYLSNLISNLTKSFDNIILTGNDLMQFEIYLRKVGSIREIIEKFKRYHMLEFGPRLRFKLIKKWNELGSEQLTPNELIRLNNEMESYVESIIGKNFVPSYPLYILTILQSRETNSIQKPEYSMHGFYYELLINDALNKAIQNKEDISLFYNYITEYSYFLFTKKIKRKPLHIDEFIKFHESYCKEYNINYQYELILDTLVKSKLIKISQKFISITYKYVYYFFVAKYLANNISKKEIKDIVKQMSLRVHRDEFASIIMFLTHLSKDQFILNQLLEDSKEMFKDYTPCNLDGDILFMNEMVERLPKQVYEPIDIELLKDEELREEEELDAQEREFDFKKDVCEYDLDEDISSLDIVSKLTRAVKTIEIIGQVTKKYWGELKALQKYELAEETYMLGLRALNFYISLIGKNPKLLVEYLNHIYRKRHLNKNLSKNEVEQASVKFLFGLCVMASYGIVKRITRAIGYEKLSETFSDILEKHNFNAVKLIDTSIKLDHNKEFPWEEVKSLNKATTKHFLPNVVLQNLVINYLYVFHTSIEEKQKICSLLGIKIDKQRLIDMKSTIKKE